MTQHHYLDRYYLDYKPFDAYEEAAVVTPYSGPMIYCVVHQQPREFILFQSLRDVAVFQYVTDFDVRQQLRDFDTEQTPRHVNVKARTR